MQAATCGELWEGCYCVIIGILQFCNVNARELLDEELCKLKVIIYFSG